MRRSRKPRIPLLVYLAFVFLAPLAASSQDGPAPAERVLVTHAQLAPKLFSGEVLVKTYHNDVVVAGAAEDAVGLLEGADVTPGDAVAVAVGRPRAAALVLGGAPAGTRHRRSAVDRGAAHQQGMGRGRAAVVGQGGEPQEERLSDAVAARAAGDQVAALVDAQPAARTRRGPSPSYPR